MGDLGVGYGDPALAVKADARRVEFVDADDVVESSGSSTTFHVCKVASGANDTLRFAGSHVSSVFYPDQNPPTKRLSPRIPIREYLLPLTLFRCCLLFLLTTDRNTRW